MRNLLKLCACSLLALLVAVVPAMAGPIKVYVGELNVVGAQNRDELKAALQPLLASRLSGAGVIAVTHAAEADALVSGTYVAIGPIFSLDAVISLPDKKTLARSYVQGDSQAQLLPAIEKLAEKLRPELLKVTPATPRPVATVPLPPVVMPPVPAAPVAADIVRVPQQPSAGTGIWRSARLNGAMVSLAMADRAADGSRDLFMAEPDRLYHYRLHGTELRLIAEKKLPLYKKILYLDTLPTANGATELLVTIVANEQLVSQIWQSSRTGGLQLVADNQPFFLRALSLAGGPKRLYAQKLGAISVFSEPIHAAKLQNGAVTLQEALKLPANLSIYSFGQFTDKNGQQLTVALAANSRLVVYNRELVEQWQSAEAYSESELFMEKRDIAAVGEQEAARVYLPQRVTVMANGEVLVSKNDTLPLLGVKSGLRNGRSYGLAWNGADMAARWHTRSTDNYLADFCYDPLTRELLQLEVASRPNILSRGSSIIAVRTVE